ncbi:MAG: hypothetical protein ACOYJ2_00330 [Rickettsiales bacterium]
MEQPQEPLIIDMFAFADRLEAARGNMKDAFPVLDAEPTESSVNFNNEDRRETFEHFTEMAIQSRDFLMSKGHVLEGEITPIETLKKMAPLVLSRMVKSTPSAHPGAINRQEWFHFCAQNLRSQQTAYLSELTSENMQSALEADMKDMNDLERISHPLAVQMQDVYDWFREGENLANNPKEAKTLLDRFRLTWDKLPATTQNEITDTMPQVMEAIGYLRASDVCREMATLMNTEWDRINGLFEPRIKPPSGEGWARGGNGTGETIH